MAAHRTLTRKRVRQPKVSSGLRLNRNVIDIPKRRSALGRGLVLGFVVACAGVTVLGGLLVQRAMITMSSAENAREVNSVFSLVSHVSDALRAERENSATGSTEGRQDTDDAVLALTSVRWPSQVAEAAKSAQSALDGLAETRAAFDAGNRDLAVDAYAPAAQAMLRLAVAISTMSGIQQQTGLHGSAGLLAVQEHLSRLRTDAELVRSATAGAQGRTTSIVAAAVSLRDLLDNEPVARSSLAAIAATPAFTTLATAAADPTVDALVAPDLTAATIQIASEVAKAARDAASATTSSVDTAVAQAKFDMMKLGGTALAVLIGCAAIGHVVVRQTLQPIIALRDKAVSLVTGGDDTQELVTRTPGDEIAQVSLFLDALHDQSAQIAEAERSVRQGNIDVLVGLSRRSQTLIGQQLGFIERWERDFEAARIKDGQLETLLKLDHLATRIRRVNENLVLLSGEQAANRSSKPVVLETVLQAAVSEIEQYERVKIGDTPAVKVKGGLAKDLIRLCAELMENSTIFSPPDTDVEVSARMLGDDSLMISVSDSGVGMKDDVAAEANARLAHVSPEDLVGARKFGLFVVGRLASRHSLGVSIDAGTGRQGVRAVVTVPSDLLISEQKSGGPGYRDGTELPRRQPETSSANGRPTLRSVPTGPPLQDRSTGTSPFFATRKPSIAAEKPSAPLPAAGVAADHHSPGWFSKRPSENRDHEPASTRAERTWSTAADDGWKIVETVANHTSDYNDQGLPVRVRGHRLVPGGVGDSAFVTGARPRRTDAEELRARLSQFRAGLARQREASEAENQEQTGLGDSAHGPSGHASTAGRNGSEWTMLGDNGWQQAKAIAELDHEILPESGLPLRVRGQRYLPGSARTSLLNEPRPGRDPEELRDRLGSFRRGLATARNDDW